jgi:hypothetical protein
VRSPSLHWPHRSPGNGTANLGRSRMTSQFSLTHNGARYNAFQSSSLEVPETRIDSSQEERNAGFFFSTSGGVIAHPTASRCIPHADLASFWGGVDGHDAAEEGVNLSRSLRGATGGVIGRFTGLAGFAWWGTLRSARPVPGTQPSGSRQKPRNNCRPLCSVWTEY